MRRNLRFTIYDLRFAGASYALLAGVLMFICGCAGAPPKVSVNPAGNFPAEAFVTQRAVFSAGTKQFPLNGYLALSATRGKRLIVTGPFDAVMADLLVKPDGTISVLQTSRMFSARSIRYGVASDLQNIFGGAPLLPTPVLTAGTNHFIINHGRYVLDLRVVEIKAGVQPDTMFDETKILRK
jgi:hypothetical protein